MTRNWRDESINTGDQNSNQFIANFDYFGTSRCLGFLDLNYVTINVTLIVTLELHLTLTLQLVS